MTARSFLPAALLASSLCLFLPGRAAEPEKPAEGGEPPLTWVDPATGHRVHRLTREPGSASLYFNENGYTPDGKRMIYTTPEGISVLNLETREAHAVVQGKVRAVAAGHKFPTVFYMRTQERALYATNLDTGEERKLADLPKRGRVATINADETLAAGAYVEGEGQDPNQRRGQGEKPRELEVPPNKGKMMEDRLAARLPMVMFTVNLQTGETKNILHSTDWLGHLLFSPTDPTLLMYCHEGPWQKVDRVWTIRTDGTENTLRHERRMAMEIAGHEFWSRDGKTIWYDLQAPKGSVFYLAGDYLPEEERTWYHLERNEWSIHFNVSADGTLFCGDGGDPGQVARARDGEWIYLFHPQKIRADFEFAKGLVRPGILHAEKLVNMNRHRYKLEPNVSFTPDQKMVVFRSNRFGPTYVFGVEVQREVEVPGAPPLEERKAEVNAAVTEPKPEASTPVHEREKEEEGE